MFLFRNANVVVVVFLLYPACKHLHIFVSSSALFEMAIHIWVCFPPFRNEMISPVFSRLSDGGDVDDDDDYVIIVMMM